MGEWKSAAVARAAHTALRGLLAAAHIAGAAHTAAHTAEAAHTAAVDEAFHGDGGAGAARGDGIGTALCHAGSADDHAAEGLGGGEAGKNVAVGIL